MGLENVIRMNLRMVFVHLPLSFSFYYFKYHLHSCLAAINTKALKEKLNIIYMH